MTFLWPGALVLVLAVPAFLAFYVRLEKHKSAAAHRHPALLARSTQPAAQRPFTRHIPLLLFLTSLAALSLALARPQAVTTMFAVKGTVVLAVDVSISMKADDVLPSRLARSQSLAKDLVAKHSDDLRIGLVSFGANAAADLDPTTDREQLFAAIDRLAVQKGTAVGSGITTALAMIFPDAGIGTGISASGRNAAPAVENIEARPRVERAAPAPGSRPAAAIVLISDGESTSGPDPIEAARLAADLGVRIHTIGVGSTEGKPMHVDGWAMRVQLDEGALKAIAKLTHGEYFPATSRIDWTRILDSIRPQPPREQTYTEITALFAAAAALAAAAGAVVSLLRTKRIL